MKEVISHSDKTLIKNKNKTINSNNSSLLQAKNIYNYQIEQIKTNSEP